MNWYFDQLNSLFARMDHFGTEHWGFMATSVFLAMLISGTFKAVRRTVNWFRDRRQARFFQRYSGALAGTRYRARQIADDPDIGHVIAGHRGMADLGTTGFTSRDSGRHDVEHHKAASQAGLASFQGVSLSSIPPENLRKSPGYDG